jgi:serpin B
MLKVALVFTLFYISSSLCFAVLSFKPVTKPPAESTNDFALKLYNQLKYDPKFRNTNIFFSPLSIAIAMGMTHLGARGRTARQMENSFGWNPRTINSDFKELGKALESNSTAFILRLANRIWGQSGMTILPSFLRDSKDYFKAGMVQADFLNAHEQARQEINEWVENKTEDKILKLLKPGTVSPSTEMVLVNAIYFKLRELGKNNLTRRVREIRYSTETVIFVKAQRHK